MIVYSVWVSHEIGGRYVDTLWLTSAEATARAEGLKDNMKATGTGSRFGVHVFPLPLVGAVLGTANVGPNKATTNAGGKT